ncbi:alpha/beta fold hydrolase [Streptomyces sp. NPDC057717]
MAEFGQLFPDAEFVVRSGAGHFPWLDDAAWFVTATADFLK